MKAHSVEYKVPSHDVSLHCVYGRWSCGFVWGQVIKDLNCMMMYECR